MLKIFNKGKFFKTENCILCLFPRDKLKYRIMSHKLSGITINNITNFKFNLIFIIIPSQNKKKKLLFILL